MKELISQKEINSLVELASGEANEDISTYNLKLNEEYDKTIIPELKKIAHSLYLWYFINKQKDGIIINHNIMLLEDNLMDYIRKNLDQLDYEEDWDVRAENYMCTIIKQEDVIRITLFSCFVRKFKEIKINLKDFYLYIQPIIYTFFIEKQTSNSLLHPIAQYMHKSTYNYNNPFISIIIKINGFIRNDSLWYS